MSSTSTKKFSVGALLRGIKRHPLYFVIPVVVLVPAVSYYAMKLPTKYRAEALVGPDPLLQNLGNITGKSDAGAANGAQDLTRAIEQTLRSESALQTTIRKFNLYPVTPEEPSWKALEDMKDAIQIHVESADAFRIGFEGATPQQTMDVTNYLANRFVQSSTTVRDDRGQQEDSFLDAEVARVRALLDEQDSKLKSYRQSGAQQLPERLDSNLKQLQLLQEQIQNKTDQITSAEATRSADTDELAALEKQGVLAPEPKQKSPSEIAIEDARKKLAQLQIRYMPDHPEVKRAQQELRELEAAPPTPAPVVTHQPSPVQLRYFALQAELKALEPRLKNYRQEHDALVARSQSFERVVNSSPGYETGLTEITRDEAATRANYEALVAKQQDAHRNHRAEKVDQGVTYKVVEPAALPRRPYSPHRLRIIGGAVVGSLALGLMAVFMAVRLDTTFETGEQVEDAMEMPVLSTIPSIATIATVHENRKKKDRFAPVPQGYVQTMSPERRQQYQLQRIATLGDPQGIAAQQYGILALKLQKWTQDTGGKIVAITSSTTGEGKSVTALNLSIAMAALLDGGVLLADCDLRLPQAHTRLGLEKNRGFADLLAHPESDPAQFMSKVGELDVLSAGEDSPSHVELLGPARAQQVFTALRSRYKLIILDCPPIVPIADSHILADLSDGVVIVARARATGPELLQRALDSLDAKNLIGIVLNDVEYEGTPYGYAYRNYQRHYLG